MASRPLSGRRGSSAARTSDRGPRRTRTTGIRSFSPCENSSLSLMNTLLTPYVGMPAAAKHGTVRRVGRHVRHELHARVAGVHGPGHRVHDVLAHRRRFARVRLAERLHLDLVADDLLQRRLHSSAGVVPGKMRQLTVTVADCGSALSAWPPRSIVAHAGRARAADHRRVRRPARPPRRHRRGRPRTSPSPAPIGPGVAVADSRKLPIVQSFHCTGNGRPAAS